MPKEQIYDRNAREHPDTVATAQVAWGRDSEHVELATIADDNRDLTPTPEGNGWFVQLDRHGINQLIRTLRRARDQAYGRDE